MRSSKTSLVVALIFTLGLFLGLGTALAAADADVAATLKAYFGAAAKGDTEAMKKMSLGKASKNLPRKGSKGYQMMMMMGAAFEKSTDVKVSGDKAKANANFKVAAMEKALMEMAKADLAKMKDAKKKADAEKMMKQMIPQLAKRMSKVPIQLVKKGGKWLIAGFKK
ncbi:MAG: hypothetical protein KJ621_09550 [Proteobacteria bacterium]|nr:hypothetical protein [Pseudomonadota bacterium]MBU1741901.1 hypothetical protein [Pseudomonadota bacterium]